MCSTTRCQPTPRTPTETKQQVMREDGVVPGRGRPNPTAADVGNLRPRVAATHGMSATGSPRSPPPTGCQQLAVPGHRHPPDVSNWQSRVNFRPVFDLTLPVADTQGTPHARHCQWRTCRRRSPPRDRRDPPRATRLRTTPRATNDPRTTKRRRPGAHHIPWDAASCARRWKPPSGEGTVVRPEGFEPPTF